MIGGYLRSRRFLNRANAAVPTTASGSQTAAAVDVLAHPDELGVPPPGAPQGGTGQGPLPEDPPSLPPSGVPASIPSSRGSKVDSIARFGVKARAITPQGTSLKFGPVFESFEVAFCAMKTPSGNVVPKPKLETSKPLVLSGPTPASTRNEPTYAFPGSRL